MNRLHLITAMLSVLVLSSCSVKEDRTPCPCWLCLDITPSKAYSKDVTLSAWNEGRIFSQTVSIADYPSCYEQTVPKGHVNVSAYCGRRESMEEGGRIIIPLGCESDPIRAHLRSVDCLGEFAHDTLNMCKQWATVHLKIENSSDDQYPYSLSVESDICGIDLRNLSPIKGQFRYDLDLDSQESCSFRLPRQRDDSKAVIVTYADNDRLDELPLYQWIEQTGYSWHDKDLKDIYIGVDYVRAEVTIIIQGWDEGDSYEVRL